jgi:hypothetical protein
MMESVPGRMKNHRLNPVRGDGNRTICQSKNLFKEITKMVKSGTESPGASIIWGYIKYKGL